MTTNVTYRDVGAVVPISTTIKGAPLSNAEIDGNIKSLVDSIDGLSAPGGAALVGYDGGTAQDVLDEAKPMANYTALRAYTGRATGVRITQSGLAGFFQRDASDTTSADNGGTIIVDASGRRWKRLYDGEVNALWFGIDPTGVTNCYSAAEAAWAYCLANGKDLYLPSGTYRITSANNFPFGRINGLPPTSLLDCKNITIFGDGPTTILRTDTVAGADVLQFNGAKNLHVRNLMVTATISGSGAGSNGVSITGGYDNITLDHIWCENLPSLDKTVYVDGGKALSIQTPVAGQTVTCGKLKATNIYAKGCVYGFGLELDLVAASTMSTSIEVDIVAEDCRDAVVISAGEATSAIPASWTMGVKVRAQAINCMRDVGLGRAHGVDVECQVITTKTDAARILNPQGVKWLASDTIASVEGLRCTYAHKSSVVIYGNKGNCSYKARVGAATAGASGLTAATWQSQISVSLAGTASTADFGAVDSGGNVTSECTLVTTGATSAPVSDHYLPSRNNVIVFGNSQSLKDVLVQGAVKFPHTDGLTTFGGEVGFDAEGITVKQKSSGSVDAQVLKVLNNAGATKFIVRNDGAFGSAGRYTASAVATVKGVMPIYDESNTLYGYVPVYTSYTP